MTREERYESLMTPAIERKLRHIAMQYNHQEAEDMVQEALLSSWSALDKFRGGNFGAWVIQILKFIATNRWRQMKTTKWKTNISIEEVEPLARQDVDNSYSDEVKNALESITDDHREMILLVDVDELTYDEAAKKVGIPSGTVMSRVFRARNQMREKLEMVS